jgi:hypothetical protein
MDRLIKGFIVTLFGIATTVLTAFGLVYLELRYDCAIYGFVYGFVLPFGAFLSGLVAASGYFFGSRLLSYLPKRSMLVIMMVVSGANFFFIYWLKYCYLTVDGEPVRNFMTYPAYLAFALTHTNFKPDQFSDSFTLGWAGYGYGVLLILGFAFGGWCIYNLVRSRPYCEECGIYLKKMGKQTRYFVRREQLVDSVAAFKALTGRGEFLKAVNEHAGTGTNRADDSTGYCSVVDVKECKRCGKQWFELIPKQRVNKSWNEIRELKVSTFSTERVQALEEMTWAG